MTKNTAPHLGLAGILFALIVRAEQNADGKFHLAPLKNGLRLEVQMAETEMTLRIFRIGAVPPSRTEWKTCLKNLPAAYQPVVPVAPVEFFADGRFYLSGTWPLRPKLMEGGEHLE